MLEALDELAFELLAAELFVAPDVDELRDPPVEPEFELDCVLDPESDPPAVLPPPPAELPDEAEEPAVPLVELPE